MDDSLKIECEWLGPESYSDPESVCRAAIGISSGDRYLTSLVDSWAATTRLRVNANAYTLAQWIAGNWWRLRWEPETQTSQTDNDWRMSHSMASAGGGYSWPSILFASDGETIAIASRSSAEKVMGPVRYLTDFKGKIPAEKFERELDVFLSMVLSRLHAMGHVENELAELWKEVEKERNDPIIHKLRRLEALCGYDPGEAPDSLMQLLLSDPYNLGKHAIEEVAAHSRQRSEKVLQEIKEISDDSSRKAPVGGFRSRPAMLKSKPKYHAHMHPWEKGALLARKARNEWNLGSEPVSNVTLAGILKISQKAFNRPNSEPRAPMTLGLHAAKNDNAMDIFFDKKHMTSRRFAASRLLGQWIESNGTTERLIPVGDAKTAQQQFQRAFAQEFLCPYAGLVNRLPSQNQEDIEESAEHFGVSPFLIKTALVNHGDLNRDALSWAV